MFHEMRLLPLTHGTLGQSFHLCAALPLPIGQKPRIESLMNRFFNISDHDRLPWRFYGATRAILARR
jgi:hypothetical protein